MSIRNKIYLDNAATSWPKPSAVYEAVADCLTTVSGSPGRGGHSQALTATQILYSAREELARLLHFDDPTRIAFMLNATDAINTALFGLLRPGMHVVTTSMEHNAVSRPLTFLASAGIKVTIIPCDKHGEINMTAMEEAMRGGVDLIVASHASNVTGTIMPVADIGALAKNYGTIFMVDAAQTAGVEEIDVQAMNIDLLAFSGHKGLLGPQGTGGLYVRPGLKVTPLRYGGTGSLSEKDQQPECMPDHLESGTQNTPGIAGLLAGVRFINQIGRENIRQKEKQLEEKLWRGLNEIKGVSILGPTDAAERTAVVSFVLGADCGIVAHKMEQEFGIVCRAGLHCAPWAHKTLGTISTGTVRLSPGFFNTMEEIDEVLLVVTEIAQKLDKAATV